MEESTESLLSAGGEALEAGDWERARDSFGAALAREETAEALMGLGNALWWLGETELSVRHQERAYAEFRRRPDPAQAALLAVGLCIQYQASLGNSAASQGWLRRLARLVEELDLAAFRGWLCLCRAMVANDIDRDPVSAERWAKQAREIARADEDADLELCALSEIGSALIELGRIDEGVALLDEAMAGSLGGEGDPDTVVYTSCRTIISCSHAAEVKRAAQWVQAADEFNRRYGNAHLYAVCRTHYGALMLCTGRWAEAEQELGAAIRMSKAGEPALHAEALAKLAELRLAQGKLEEAARLVAGLEDHPATSLVRGSVHLARGEVAVADSTLRRGLRELGEERLECAPLSELLSEVELAREEPDSALARARGLADQGAKLSSELVAGWGERALGRVLAFTGDGVAARAHLERALAIFAGLGMPFEASRARLLLARAAGEDDREVAIAEARAALAGFEELGAGRDADAAAALLRSLGVKAARSGPKGLGLLTKRELEVLGLLGEGLSNPAIAERLFLSRKTVEHHVRSVLSKLDLTNRAEAAAYAARHLDPERESASK